MITGDQFYKIINRTSIGNIKIRRQEIREFAGVQQRDMAKHTCGHFAKILNANNRRQSGWTKQLVIVPFR